MSTPYDWLQRLRTGGQAQLAPQDPSAPQIPQAVSPLTPQPAPQVSTPLPPAGSPDLSKTESTGSTGAFSDNAYSGPFSGFGRPRPMGAGGTAPTSPGAVGLNTAAQNLQFPTRRPRVPSPFLGETGKP